MTCATSPDRRGPERQGGEEEEKAVQASPSARAQAARAGCQDGLFSMEGGPFPIQKHGTTRWVGIPPAQGSPPGEYPFTTRRLHDIIRATANDRRVLFMRTGKLTISLGLGLLLLAAQAGAVGDELSTLLQQVCA